LILDFRLRIIFVPLHLTLLHLHTFRVVALEAPEDLDLSDLSESLTFLNYSVHFTYLSLLLQMSSLVACQWFWFVRIQTSFESFTPRNLSMACSDTSRIFQCSILSRLPVSGERFFGMPWTLDSYWLSLRNLASLSYHLQLPSSQESHWFQKLVVCHISVRLGIFPDSPFSTYVLLNVQGDQGVDSSWRWPECLENGVLSRDLFLNVVLDRLFQESLEWANVQTSWVLVQDLSDMCEYWI
jgi:hypothetical protein